MKFLSQIFDYGLTYLHQTAKLLPNMLAILVLNVRRPRRKPLTSPSEGRAFVLGTSS